MSTTTANPSPRSEFLAGMKAIIPLEIGAVPFGIIFGALASTSGLSPAATQGMSLFVFAGSAQFIAAGLVAAGTSTLIIVLTTLVVNLRHLLYAVTLAPYMQGLPPRWLVPLGFWLTDESFVVVIQRFQRLDRSPHKHWFFLGTAVLMYANWQLCTFIGILAGQWIDDPMRWGLDFAMFVTFIGMLVPMVRSKPMLSAVLVSGAAALALRGLPHQLGLIAAALAGVAAGMLLEHTSRRRTEKSDDRPG